MCLKICIYTYFGCIRYLGSLEKVLLELGLNVPAVTAHLAQLLLEVRLVFALPHEIVDVLGMLGQSSLVHGVILENLVPHLGCVLGVFLLSFFFLQNSPWNSCMPCKLES